MKILFYCSNPEYAVMLRYEASATDETDASCLSMTASLKKIGTNSGAAVSDETADIRFRKIIASETQIYTERFEFVSVVFLFLWQIFKNKKSP